MGPLIDLLPLSYTDSVVLLGAIVMGLTAGLLGTFAVLARRSLVGDALAHSALPGVAIAFIITGAKDPATLLIGAAIAGLLGAMMIHGIERSSRLRADAAIGVVLSSCFSLGIVLLTHISGGGNAQQAGLEKYLFGQAAGLLERDVQVMAAICVVAVCAVVVLARPLKVAIFDRDFAGSVGLPLRMVELGSTVLLVVAVVIGLRMVGAILMVAMLIAPAVVARQVSDRLGVVLAVSALTGALIGAVGSLASAAAEVPTGPVIVLVGLAMVIAAVALTPRRGVVWSLARRRRERRREETAALLIDLETALHSGPPPTTAELQLASPRPARVLRRSLRALDRANLIERDGERLRLSETGAGAAHAALDQRRQWSMWLEHGWRLDLPDAREADPRDLAASIGGDALARLRAIAAAEVAR